MHKGVRDMNDRRFSSEDLAANRVWAALGYIVFFIPLIKSKHSSLGRYCANQGLLLWIVGALLRIFFGIFGDVPLIGWLFLLIGRLACLALLIIGLMCMVQLLNNDRVTELPYIGKIRLIK